MSEESHLEDLRTLTEKQISDEQLWKTISSAVIESLPDALVVADDTGNIIRVNNQTELIFGYHRSELRGKNVEILLPKEIKERHLQHRAKYIQEPRPRVMGAGMQLKGCRKDGTEFPADISLSPVMTPQGLFIVVVIRRTKEPHAPAR